MRDILIAMAIIPAMVGGTSVVAFAQYQSNAGHPNYGPYATQPGYGTPSGVQPGYGATQT